MRYLLIIVFANSVLRAQPTTPERPPSVLFIFTDDQTYTTIRALGNDEIYTPNLDRLVRDGTTFTHAFNMGAWGGAVCVASRAMLISGRALSAAHRRDRSWASGDTTSYQQTWPRLMASAGYRTYMTGKWHVEAPVERLFHRIGTVRGGMPPDPWTTMTWPERDSLKKVITAAEVYADVALPGYGRPISENDRRWEPTDTAQGGFWEGGTHWSEVVSSEAVQFLDEAENDDRPFFLYAAFNAPHDPRQAPREYLDLYPLDSISLPKNFAPDHPYRDKIGNPIYNRDESLAPLPRTPYAVRKHRQEYYAAISHLDAQIGKILDHLRSSDQADNTYVIFTSDHGLAIGSHGLIGKQSLYEHTIRVPLIVVGPDVPAGERIDTPVYLQDAMATSLDLAGVESDSLFFRSLLPVINASASAPPYPDGIFGSYMDVQRMIRKDGYKLIVYPEVPKVLLFDLENDPYELHDLSGATEHRERRQEMLKALAEMEIDYQR